MIAVEAKSSICYSLGPKNGNMLSDPSERTKKSDSRLIVRSANGDLHGRETLLKLGEEPRASSESPHQPHGLPRVKGGSSNLEAVTPTLIMPWDATT